MGRIPKKKDEKVVFEEQSRYVAGIDLAGHADHYVCGPRSEDGEANIQHFGTTTNELGRMADWLIEQRVVSAAMESTSVYWIPVCEMLESRGIETDENSVTITVREGTHKPYFLPEKGLKPSGVYVRQGASSVPASYEQIREMIK